MDIANAQKDMRYGYFGGGVGMFVSGIVWLSSGVTAINGQTESAIWVLLIGGTFIYPISMIITKLLGRPAAPTRGNPLGTLAIESTVWMMLCLPMVYGVSRMNLLWFYPAMLLVIGGRYLTFSTMYGLRIYWLCGFLLATAGVILVVTNTLFMLEPFAGAFIEITLSAFVFAAGRKESKL